MSFVLSQQQGWAVESLNPAILGPFGSLRDGVSSPDGNTSDDASYKAEFFMWEHFTTKPYFQPSVPSATTPPLKKIGEIYTPWPSWLIVASTKTFPTPESDESLQALFELLDKGIAEYESKPEEVVRLLGTGDFKCTYAEDDAKEWMKATRFVEGTRGLSEEIVQKTVDVLKVAGVIDQQLALSEAIERVTGISR